MGLVERIKTQYEMWKIEKYTKRRPIVSSNFEQRGKNKMKG